MDLDHHFESIAAAERLAHRWMKGTRQGSGRAAWQHPLDVVLLVAGCPRPESLNLAHMLQLAWLHDVLEDGTHEKGFPISAEDLENEGMNDLVIAEVCELTHSKRESKPEYLTRLRSASLEVKLVKCCARIANLREGVGVFTPERGAWYVAETREYIEPLAQGLPEPARTWLLLRLAAAAGMRGATAEGTGGA